MKVADRIGNQLLKLFRCDASMVQICQREDGRWQVDVISDDRARGVQVIDESLARALTSAARDWSAGS